MKKFSDYLNHKVYYKTSFETFLGNFFKVVTFVVEDHTGII